MTNSFNDYMLSFLSDYTSKHRKISYDTELLSQVVTVAAQDFFIRKDETSNIYVKVKTGAGVCLKSEDNNIINPYNVNFIKNSYNGKLVADDIIFYNIYIDLSSFSQLEYTIIVPDIDYLKIKEVDDIVF
jgi:glutaredoxin 2